MELYVLSLFGVLHFYKHLHDVYSTSLHFLYPDKTISELLHLHFATYVYVRQSDYIYSDNINRDTKVIPLTDSSHWIRRTVKVNIEQILCNCCSDIKTNEESLSLPQVLESLMNILLRKATITISSSPSFTLSSFAIVLTVCMKRKRRVRLHVTLCVIKPSCISTIRNFVGRVRVWKFHFISELLHFCLFLFNKTVSPYVLAYFYFSS